MKPFNLKEAMERKPVVTRDGRNARVIADDVKYAGKLLLAVAIENGRFETLHTFNRNGMIYNWGGLESDNDLFMKGIKKWKYAYTVSSAGVEVTGITDGYYSSDEEFLSYHMSPVHLKGYTRLLHTEIEE